MSTNRPNEYELTEEKFYEYELTEKWVRVDQNENELTWVRIDLRTNWLRTLTDHNSSPWALRTQVS